MRNLFVGLILIVVGLAISQGFPALFPAKSAVEVNIWQPIAILAIAAVAGVTVVALIDR